MAATTNDSGISEALLGIPDDENQTEATQRAVLLDFMDVNETPESGGSNRNLLLLGVG